MKLSKCEKSFSDAFVKFICTYVQAQPVLDKLHRCVCECDCVYVVIEINPTSFTSALQQLNISKQGNR